MFSSHLILSNTVYCDKDMMSELFTRGAPMPLIPLEQSLAFITSLALSACSGMDITGGTVVMNSVIFRRLAKKVLNSTEKNSNT
jgi:hypothetical protein